MTVDQIRSLSQRMPFRPFRVHMANGRSLDIPHPDFMHLSVTGRWLMVEQLDEGFELVDVLLVTSLEALPRNGKAPRRQRGKSKS